MELVEGEPLSDLLARGGPLSVDRTLQIVGPAAEALQAAHDAGVVHRDVKPSNILLRPDGSGVALTDFGIARATNDPAHLTRTGLVVGTATYLSPEQASGQPTTPASDVYALGVVTYECLTGTPPFTGDNPVQVAVAHLRDEVPPLPADVPAGVAALVLAMLAKDPADRPPSAGAVAEAAAALRIDPGRPMAGWSAAASRPAGPGGARSSSERAGMAASAEPRSGDSQPTARLEPDDEVAAQPRWHSDAYPDQRRARHLMLLAGLVVVVVGAVLLALVGGGSGKAHPSVTLTPAKSRSATALVTSSALIGRPYADVARTLQTRGLAVRRVDVVSTAPAGTVIAITPVGTVPVHSTVTVSVATQAVAPKPGRGHGPGKDHGPGHKHGHKHGHGEGGEGD
jgi:serine/threonine-protein kinase